MSGTAQELDRRCKELATRARQSDAELATALREMRDTKFFRVLGYPRLEDYAEVELQMGGGKARELAELATKLEGLPLIRGAFEAGELPWTKGRLIARVATVEDQERWLDDARLPSRVLERKVAEARGERPAVRIAFEASEADVADIDDAVRELREEIGEEIPLGEAIAELARRARGAPVERPGCQLIIHDCPTCKKATRETRAGAIEVPPAVVEAAKVDAEILDLREGGKGKRSLTITKAERRAVRARDHDRCALCGTQKWLHIHHLVRKRGDVAVLSLLCSACHKRLVHSGHVTMAGREGEFVFHLRNGEVRKPAFGVT